MRSGGRSKGTPNKITHALRSMLSDHLSVYLHEQFITDWHQIPARERVRVCSSLLKLIVPPPPVEESNEPDQPTDVKVTIVTAKEEIDRLNELRTID